MKHLVKIYSIDIDGTESLVENLEINNFYTAEAYAISSLKINLIKRKGFEAIEDIIIRTPIGKYNDDAYKYFACIRHGEIYIPSMNMKYYATIVPIVK